MAIPAVNDATDYPITINKSCDFLETLTITTDGSTPVDLTSATGAAKIRSDFGTAATVLATFTVTITDAANGVLTLELTDTVTDGLGASTDATDENRTVQIGFWDLELTEGTKTYRYVQGSVTVSREATT